MTQIQFQGLAFLLFEHEVLEVTGYARNTLRKFVDNGVMKLVKPAGAGQGKYQKIQVAQLVGASCTVEQFWLEPMLMPEKAVRLWTGYAGDTLKKIAEAGGVKVVRPAGCGGARYHKQEVAGWIGLEKWV